jgi:hypothetical protein
LDNKIKEMQEIPYTLSYIIRKRLQIDNYNELPREKRPTDEMIFNSPPEELDSWLDKVLSGKQQTTIELSLDEREIE